ncbi:MAG: hypoxanthine phosphoribosyltransferase [Planctomycetes bacterium]|nr:hypoxanthine phosphoribosyltransferase [Planctomycetota bacterium]
MLSDIEKVLISRQRIAHRLKELSAQIARDLDDLPDEAEIVLVPILTGSIIFLADLIRQLPQKIRIEVVTVAGYPGKSMTSQGPQIIGALPDDLKDKHVLIVDDILDSGSTLRLIREKLASRQPKSLRACVLLRKQRQSALDTPCEYVGFDIPDVFVVGYGLDYNNYYRNLPDIGTLRKEAL